MKIRHDIFMITVILLLGIVSIAANKTNSQTADTIPAKNPKLIEKLKVLNAIEAQQKQEKEQLFEALDSSVVKVKELAVTKNEIGKIVDESRWMIHKLSVQQIPPKKKDTLIMALPRIEVDIPRSRILPHPEVTPKAAVERIKKQNLFKRIFNFL